MTHMHIHLHKHTRLDWMNEFIFNNDKIAALVDAQLTDVNVTYGTINAKTTGVKCFLIINLSKTH